MPRIPVIKMGASELSENPSSELKEQLYAGLPTKITVIVFWGFIWAGIIFSLLILKDIDQQLIDRYISRSTLMIDELEQQYEATEKGSLSTINDILEKLRTKYDLKGIELTNNNLSLIIGDKQPDMSSYTHHVSLINNTGKTIEHAKVITYYPDIDQLIFNERKKFLLTAAVFTLLYALFLIWILKNILTRPFFSMIMTAQAVSSGDTSARFNEDRNDEFGFLAKFFNRVMDQLIQKQDELYEEKERAEVTLHSIGDAVITTNDEARITYLNPVALQLTKWKREDVINKPISSVMRLIDERNDSIIPNPVESCLLSENPVALEDRAVLLRDNNERMAIADSAAPIRDRNGKVIGAIMVFHDVAESRRLQQQLTYQASHDALTDLYNRNEFETQLERTLIEARRDNSKHVLCYLDLDQFKIVNDTCGHVAGDELLQQLSRLLNEHVRNADVLARLGGDEFGILFKYCSLEQASKASEKIAGIVSNFRFLWDEHSFNVTASIGLASIDKSIKDLTAALTAADLACYSAKDSGRNRIHVYKPDDEELKQRHGEMRWVPKIKHALENDNFVLYYQSIVPVENIEDDINRYEILVRMRGKGDVIVPPMAFIPAAERYDLMHEIDRWVIDNTLKFMSDNSNNNWVFSINLSGQSLCKEGFLDYVLSKIKQSNITPEKLCFEITETAAIANLNDAIYFINQLKQIGCSFSLDDFGSGLSSFSYLKNLKVDYLKIDGSFIKNITGDPINNAMVQAINEIGHVMNIRTIAEFVENEQIIAQLKAIGIDYVQGYGIDMPRPLERLVGNISEDKIKLSK